jgi:hypothetical protein
MDASTFVASSLCGTCATLKGIWGNGSRRRWDGTISADEPIVGLAIQQSYGKWSGCKSAARAGSALGVSLLLGDHDGAGVDVQVNFTCGGGQVVSRCNVSSKHYKPSIPETLNLETGRLTAFAIVNGEPDVGLMLFLLRRRDIKVGRNHLWHLRRELAEGVSEPFHRVLSYGRSGEAAA